MSMLRLSLTTALAVCAPFYAQAAVDAAGADALTKQLTDSLGSLGAAELGGAPTVKIDGDAFAVTLPSLTFNSRRDDFSVAIPQIAVRMKPMAEGVYSYVATLPTTFLTINDKAGAPRGSATATTQQITGEWNAANHHFNNSIAVLKDIVYTDTKEPLTIKIAEAGAVNQMTARENSHVDGQGSFNMRDVQIVYADKERGRAAQVKLEALGLSSTVQDYDMSGLTKAPADATANPADAAGLLARLGSIMGSAQQGGAGGTSNVSLVANGIDMVFVERKDEPPVTVKLPLVKLGGSAVSDAEQLIDLRMTYEHNGLMVKPIESRIMADLLPAAAKLDINVTNIPAGQLFQTASQTAAAMLGPKSGEGGPENLHSGAQSALALMEKAQTAIIINNISFNARALNALSQGTIKATQASPIGAVGTIDTRINGISELVKRITDNMGAAAASATTPQAQPDPMEQGVLMAMSMLQMQGKEVAGVTPSAYTYQVELTPQGSVKLNGAEMINLRGMVPDMRAGSATKEGNFDPNPTADRPQGAFDKGGRPEAVQP